MKNMTILLLLLLISVGCIGAKFEVGDCIELVSKNEFKGDRVIRTMTILEVGKERYRVTGKTWMVNTPYINLIDSVYTKTDCNTLEVKK